MHNEPKQEKMSWPYAGDLLLTGAHKSLQGLRWAFNFKERPTVAVVFLIAAIGTAENVTQRALVGEFLQLPRTLTQRACKQPKNEIMQALCDGEGTEFIAETMNL